MQLTVKDWMNDLVVFVDPDATVSEALATMRRRYINSVIVSKSAANAEYGIVTSIDICDKIVAQKRNPREMKVREVMNSPLVTVPVDMLISDCAALMKEKRIHHLPVVDSKGAIMGMVSATDFLVIAEAMGNNFEERTLS